MGRSPDTSGNDSLTPTQKLQIQVALLQQTVDRIDSNLRTLVYGIMLGVAAAGVKWMLAGGLNV